MSTRNQRTDRLLRSGRIDELVRRVEDGSLDPQKAPEAIYRLASTEDPRPLRAWLDAGVDPNWSSRPRPLIVAINAGLLSNVEALLAAGADPNADAETGGAFGQAVMESHDAIAVALLEVGAEPEREVRGVADLAGLAVAGGMLETMRRLLARGLDADTQATAEPLHLRAQALMREKYALKDRRKASDLEADEAARIDTRLREIERAQTGVFEAHARGPKYRQAPLLAIALGEGQDEVARLLREHGAAEVDADSIPSITVPAGSDEADQPVDALSALAQLLDSSSSHARNEDLDDDPDEDDEWDDWEDGLELPELATLTPEEAAHYDLDAVHARLRAAATAEGFQAAIARLEALAGNPSEAELGGGARRVHVDSRSEGGRILKSGGIEALHRALDAPGSLLVETRRAGVFLLPTNDPLEAIAAFGVLGPNVDVTHEQILAFFRDHPARLTELRHDIVAGRFDPLPYDVEDPESVRSFAIRLFALCPDAIYQGPETLDAFCEQLRRHPEHVFLWWD